MSAGQPTPQVSPALVMRDLAVRFSTPRGWVQAVAGVDLDLNAGEILGLVGESGSGKSVTLRAVTGLLRKNAAVSGRVLWQGQDLLTLPERALRQIRGRDIAMIFQEPATALNPVLTIGAQIDECLVAHGKFNAQARRTRALELLYRVGMASGEQRLKSYAHELSGGLRQRAMIAIALASSPKILLADEPTTALDVTIQDQILKLLIGLCKELGMAMILVTHDLGVVAETCDRVSVMYAGRVVETGPVDAVFRAPRHAYTHALLRSMPSGGSSRQPLEPIAGMPPRLDRPIVGCAFAARCAYVAQPCRTHVPPLASVGPKHRSACFAADRVALVEIAR